MFKDNKYNKWYFSIISNAKSRINIGYVERHHIIPKSLGGSNDYSNIVSLTAREHFICHWLLTKMIDGKERGKMIFALRMMKASSIKHNRYETILTSRVYESIKKDYYHEMSKIHSNKIPWNKGIKQSEEHNRKISEALKGKKKSEEHIRKNAESHKGLSHPAWNKGLPGTFTGKNHTDETKEKISKARNGKKLSDEHRRKISEAGQRRWNKIKEES